MTLHRWAAKRDASEPAILDALRAVGADYILLDKFDVLVWFRGRLTMLECKSTRGKKQTMRETTKRQDALLQRGWPVQLVTNPEQALRAIGIVSADAETKQ